VVQKAMAKMEQSVSEDNVSGLLSLNALVGVISILKSLIHPKILNLRV
jgi:hypothetical protein